MASLFIKPLKIFLKPTIATAAAAPAAAISPADYTRTSTAKYTTTDWYTAAKFTTSDWTSTAKFTTADWTSTLNFTTTDWTPTTNFGTTNWTPTAKFATTDWTSTAKFASTDWTSTAKSGLSTELSKLPGNYRMAVQKGLDDFHKALNVPNEIVAGILDDKFEMYLDLEEKNGLWRYKSTYFIEGNPIGGKEYEFKVGEKFNMEENGEVKEISVETLDDSLVLKGHETKIILAPLPKRYGEGISMEIKGENIPFLKAYFEKAPKMPKADEKDPGNNKEIAEDPPSSEKCPFF